MLKRIVAAGLIFAGIVVADQVVLQPGDSVVVTAEKHTCSLPIRIDTVDQANYLLELVQDFVVEQNAAVRGNHNWIWTNKLVHMSQVALMASERQP